MNSGDKKKRRVLVADDDPTILKLLSRHIPQIGVEVITAEDGAEVIKILNGEGDTISAAVLDFQMPHADGLECLKLIREKFPDMSVIFLSAEGEIEDVVSIMKAGATDYLRKPFSPDELRASLSKALETGALKTENRQLRSVVSTQRTRSEFIGDSPATRSLIEDVARIAAIDSTVLITGESGVGKSFLARQIHYASARRDSQFVTVSCPALPRELLESEMFGHEKGAFTGAHQKRVGKFEIADGGSMFLDEIGDMPIDLQPKLLNVLQDREFTRIGGMEVIGADVRVIAATNGDLKQMIEDRAFREDLYYRLNVIPLRIPPLRERREDIEPMAMRFLERISHDRGTKMTEISPQALAILIACDWRGNVRQLENSLERASAFCEGGTILPEDLPREITEGEAATSVAGEDSVRVRNTTLAELEKAAIEATLLSCGNNKAESARRLGISEKSIYNKMKKFGLR